MLHGKLAEVAVMQFFLKPLIVNTTIMATKEILQFEMDSKYN